MGSYAGAGATGVGAGTGAWATGGGAWTTGAGAGAGATTGIEPAVERVEPGKGMLAAGRPNSVRPMGAEAGRGGTEDVGSGAALPSVREGEVPGRAGGIAPGR